MERREPVIDLRQPLGHAVVIGVLRLNRKLEESPGSGSGHAPRVPVHAAIGPYLSEHWITFVDQARPDITINSRLKFRSSVHGSDKVVVEVR